MPVVKGDSKEKEEIIDDVGLKRRQQDGSFWRFENSLHESALLYHVGFRVEIFKMLLHTELSYHLSSIKVILCKCWDMERKGTVNDAKCRV